MSGREVEIAVIYNDGGPTSSRGCPNHTHRHPIHPGTLTKVVYVREHWAREHIDHYMPESGCPLCYPPGQTS